VLLVSGLLVTAEPGASQGMQHRAVLPALSADSAVLAAPTATIVASPTPSGPQPQYVVASNVDPAIESAIRDGVRLVRQFLATSAGGDVAPQLVPGVRIEILNGQPPSFPDAGNTCCGSSFHPGFFVDTARVPSGTDLARFRQTAAHEYGHVYQMSLGCHTRQRWLIGRWFTEGMSQVIALETAIANGVMTREQAMAQERNSALMSGQANYSLSQLKQNEPVWPGDIGFLALSALLTSADKDVSALRALCIAGSSQSDNDAFFEVFGRSLSEFEASFKVQ
jgi:hypothetical protein